MHLEETGLPVTDLADSENSTLDPKTQKKVQPVAEMIRDAAESTAEPDEIARELRGWYAEHYPQLAAERSELLESAIDGVVSAYAENVFPEMKIGFGTYRRQLGHREGTGCFRCHGELQQEEGRVISQDCDLCHVILAEQEPVVAEGRPTDEHARVLARLLEG